MKSLILCAQYSKASSVDPPLAEPFRESCAFVVLTSIDHIVGHRVQSHKLDAGRARTDPVTRDAFLYDVDTQPHGHHRVDGAQDRPALFQIDSGCSSS